MKKILFIAIIFLSFTSNAQPKIDSSLIVLKNAFILNYNSDKFQKGDILLKNGTIKDIQFKQAISHAENALIIDLNGQYIIPGLIDAHVHLGTDPTKADKYDDNLKRLEYLLQNGITTVRDMAGDTRYLGYLARQAMNDEISSPDIYYASLMAGRTFFSDPRTHLSGKGTTPGDCAWMKAIDLSTDIDLAVAEAKGTGATGIKIYANLSSGFIEKITESAHRQNMKVWAHAAVFPARPSEVCKANVDVISHSTLMAWEITDTMPSSAFTRYKHRPEFDENHKSFKSLMTALKKRNTIIDATLTTFKYNKKNASIYKEGIALTKLAYQKQIKIGVGTDILIYDLPQPTPLIEEMKTLKKEIGMSSLEILKAATIINAEMIGKESLIGSIEIGKQADLVILKRNPLENIENCQKISHVIKHGQIVRAN